MKSEEPYNPEYQWAKPKLYYILLLVGTSES